jgi:Leucine-rich repeat (LRR) protein
LVRSNELTYLSLVSNDAVILNRDFFQPNNLHNLHLDVNEILISESDCFKFAPNMEMLELHSDGLFEFKLEWIMRLNSLKYLILSSIDLIELNLSLLNEFTELRMLTITESRLKTIRNTLDSNINYLDLSYNYLESIEPHAFKNYTNQISLNNNRLSSRALEILTVSTPKLNLSFNRLDSLNFLLVSNIDRETLTDLQLNDTNLSHLPKGIFASLKNLAVLNLSHNLLTIIENDAFVGLDQLRKLDLEHNQIEMIEEDAFGSLIELDQLILASNRLKSLKSDYFSSLDYLTRLNLRDNQIEFISDGALDSLTNLEELDLSYNLLASNNLMGFKFLTKLRLFSV